jgi:hypothetical protein
MEYDEVIFGFKKHFKTQQKLSKDRALTLSVRLIYMKLLVKRSQGNSRTLMKKFSPKVESLRN